VVVSVVLGLGLLDPLQTSLHFFTFPHFLYRLNFMNVDCEAPTWFRTNIKLYIFYTCCPDLNLPIKDSGVCSLVVQHEKQPSLPGQLNWRF
jgi:hypothetical protein